MRRIFINVAVFAFLGALLSSMGYSFLRWQYWAVVAAALVIQVNNGLKTPPRRFRDDWRSEP